MKKLVIILFALIIMYSCSKEDQNPFEGTRWEKNTTTGYSVLEFNSSTFTSKYLNQTREIVTSASGSYTYDGSKAQIDYNTQGFADHEATISGNYLTYKNLSTNKSFQYERK